MLGKDPSTRVKDKVGGPSGGLGLYAAHATPHPSRVDSDGETGSVEERCIITKKYQNTQKKTVLHTQSGIARSIAPQDH